MASGAFYVSLDYTGWFAEIAQRGQSFSTRAKNRILTQSNRTVVEYWHRKIIPQHFEPSARSRYHYQQRKSSYRAIKRQLAAGEPVYVRGVQLPAETIIKGGTVDVVRGGSAERQAEQWVPIAATPAKAVARLRVPHYVKETQRNNGRPHLASEIKRLTHDDKRRMTRVWSKSFMFGVRQHQTPSYRKRV